jgi:hypothetical protein
MEIAASDGLDERMSETRFPEIGVVVTETNGDAHL